MTGCVFTSQYRAIEAVTAKGEILGQVGMDMWTPRSVQMHVGLASPIAARALLVPAFEYVFEFAGREIALGFLASHNRRSLKLARHLGFREAYRVVGGGAGRSDLVLMEMRKSECRWLKPESQREAA